MAWLWIGETATRLGLGEDKVRALADAGLLKSMRAPRTGPGHPRRRIEAESVDALLAVMAMPEGPERESAEEALRRRNRGEPAAS